MVAWLDSNNHRNYKAGSRLTARTGAVGCPVAITVVVPATAVRATAHTR